jgi:hypothetical protein
VSCFELALHLDLVSLSSEWINMIKENLHGIRLVVCKQLVTVDHNVHSQLQQMTTSMQHLNAFFSSQICDVLL